MDTLNIKSGWFRIAGVKFGWVKDGLDILGVGISIPSLTSPDGQSLTLKIEGTLYTLDKEEALAFVEKYNSIHWTGYGNKIAVVSKSLLDEKS